MFQDRLSNLEATKPHRSEQEVVIVHGGLRPPPRSQLVQQDRQCCIATLILFSCSLTIGYGAAIASKAQASLGVWNRGIDPDGNICGVSSASLDYPFLFLTNPEQRYIYRRVCVKECPGTTIDCLPNSVVTDCSQRISIASQDQDLITYQTFTYQNAICVPTVYEYFQAIESAYIPLELNAVMNDVWQCRCILFLNFLLMIAISLCIQHLVRVHPVHITWLSVILTMVFLGIGAVYFVSQSHAIWTAQHAAPHIPTNSLNATFINQRTNPHNPLYYLLFGVLLIALLTYGGYRLYTQLEIVSVMAEGVKVSAKILTENEKIIKIETCIELVLLATLMGYFMLVLLLNSVGTLDDPMNGYPLQVFKINPGFLLLSVAEALFAMIIYWILNHLLKCVISFMVSIWYYQQLNKLNQQADKYNPSEEALSRVILYYLGSVMVGSLLIKISKPLMFIARIFRCPIKSLEGFKTQVYSEMAMSSSSFVASSVTLEHVLQIQRSGIHQSAVDYANVFSLMINLFTGGISSYTGYSIFAFSQYSQNSYSPFVCIAINFFTGYCCSSMFMNNYSQIVGALIYVDLKDQEYFANLVGKQGQPKQRLKHFQELKEYLEFLNQYGNQTQGRDQ